MTKREKHDIDFILHKNFFDTLSSEEDAFLKNWLESSKRNAVIFNKLEKIMRAHYQEPTYINLPSMIAKITKESFDVKKTDENRKYLVWLRVAALVLLVAALVLTTYNMNWNSSDTTTNKYLTKVNPSGVKSRVFLRDSSIVWLNAESSISYYSEFSDTLRYIELEGEAYFEVHEDKTRPFIVKSGNVFTRALGTSFNIRHYDNEENTKVSLLTGKVSVEVKSQSVADLIYLEPYQDLSISKDILSITKGNMSGNMVTAWKDNILRFENASFEDVIRTVERWYGISINTDQYSRDEWKYNSEFKNQSLERVMERMGFSQKFGFDIENKKVIIYDKDYVN